MDAKPNHRTRTNLDVRDDDSIRRAMENASPPCTTNTVRGACLPLDSLYYHHLVHVFQMMRDNQRLLKRPHTHKLSSLIFCHCIVTCPRRLWGTHAIFGPESDRSLPAVSVHARLVNFDGVAIIHPHNQHFRSVYIFPWAFQNEKHNDTDRSLWVRTGSVIAHRECLFV